MKGNYTSLKRLTRGPRKIVAVSPHTPPSKWTTLDPAKSWKPRKASHPAGFQTQQATTGYIMSEIKKENAPYISMRQRSVTSPDTMALDVLMKAN